MSKKGKGRPTTAPGPLGRQGALMVSQGQAHKALRRWNKLPQAIQELAALTVCQEVCKYIPYRRSHD